MKVSFAAQQLAFFGQRMFEIQERNIRLSKPGSNLPKHSRAILAEGSNVSSSQEVQIRHDVYPLSSDVNQIFANSL